MDIFEIISGLFFLNYNGGTIHYIYGTIWRTIFNRPNFTYKEYINGSKGKITTTKWETNSIIE